MPVSAPIGDGYLSRMKEISPEKLEKRSAGKLIEIRCPFCVEAGRNAILGKVLKRRMDLLVQNAIKADDSMDVLIDVIYYCRTCDTNFVYGVIAA